MPRDPGLVLCALFTLRFEAPYILPWVAHHRRLGVDRLLLYHDDASGMWSPSLSERHSELLSALREHDNWITLYSAAALNFSGEIQTQQLAHCNVEALRLNASWAANWDLDEWLLVESRTDTRRESRQRAPRRVTVSSGVSAPGRVFMPAMVTDLGLKMADYCEKCKGFERNISFRNLQP